MVQSSKMIDYRSDKVVLVLLDWFLTSKIVQDFIGLVPELVKSSQVDRSVEKRRFDVLIIRHVRPAKILKHHQKKKKRTEIILKVSNTYKLLTTRANAINKIYYYLTNSTFRSLDS